MINFFTVSSYHSICDELALADSHLDQIIKTYGYPPFWSRPGSFESLVHIILEQQVSLASALSALNKLKQKVGELTPENVLLLKDEEVRAKLIALKGVGNWTADVYLMFALQRADIFPIGDLAAVNALKRVKELAAGVSRNDLSEIIASWQPYRTIAAMLLWHYYLSAPRRARLPGPG